VSDPLVDAVEAARRDPTIAAEIDAIYAELAAATAERQPRCDRSGACCRFDAFGHRLYVSTIELAVFGDRLGDGVRPPDEPGGCGYQVDGLCTAHAFRPLGCRMFFCDDAAELWQQDWYAKLHAAIRALHARFDVSYHYVEWRDALRRLGLVSPARPGRGLTVLSRASI
jgi:Fe-S-cluster containining protein